MLSPPYSPHADLVEDQLNVGNNNKSCLSSRVGSTAPHQAQPHRGSSSSSDSSSTLNGGDDEEPTDTDDLEETSSRSVISEFKRKRSASDAFSDETVIGSSVNGSSAIASPVSTRSPSPTSPAVRVVSRMTTCWDALKTNPVKYLRQERSLLEMYPMRRHSWAGPGSRTGSGSGSGLEDGDLGGSVGSASTTSKPGRGRGRRAHRTGSAVNSASTASSTTSVGGGSGRGRRRGSPIDGGANGGSSDGDESSGSQSGNNSVSGARSGSSSTGVRVHDLSLSQIKDYSPSLKTLPPGKSLRAEWKGAPMDLSNDPDLGALHPAEVHLASVLRLPCEVYLDSKRRLFAEKVHRLRQGLPFRRTDSQKACRIDVNKASRLFGAFEKIGWLEDELFLQYLD